MENFITRDNEIDIVSNLSLNDLRNYHQINNHSYQLCKINKIIANKLIKLNKKIDIVLNITNNKKYLLVAIAYISDSSVLA